MIFYPEITSVCVCLSIDSTCKSQTISATLLTQVKCVVVGDSEVDKTTMLKALVNVEDKYTLRKYEPTVFDFQGFDYTDEFLEPFFLKIYDTSGNRYFDRLRQLTYLDANIVVICYAIDSRKSFWNAHHRWHDEILYGFYPKNVPFIFTATKVNLRNDPKTINRLEAEGTLIVSSEEGKKLAERIAAHAYTECANVDEQSILKVLHAAFKAYRNCGIRKKITTKKF